MGNPSGNPGMIIPCIVVGQYEHSKKWLGEHRNKNYVGHLWDVNSREYGAHPKPHLKKQPRVNTLTFWGPSCWLQLDVDLSNWQPPPLPYVIGIAMSWWYQLTILNLLPISSDFWLQATAHYVSYTSSNNARHNLEHDHIVTFLSLCYPVITSQHMISQIKSLWQQLAYIVNSTTSMLQ